MQRLEYKTVDKSDWGPGPWQDEPDKVQWLDEATNYPCLIVRNGGVTGALCGYVGVPKGHPAYGLNYDGNTTENAEARRKAFREALRKKYRKMGKTVPIVGGLPDLSDVPEEEIIPVIGEGLRNMEVHGGLTFSGPCRKGEEEDGICHKPDPGEPDDVWWFGFDCAHAFDISPAMMFRNREMYAKIDAEFGIESEQHGWPKDTYRDMAYVTAQAQSLAKQLLKMEEENG